MDRESAPWIVYGQTDIPRGEIVDNPRCNLAGLAGEASLPFTVPTGSVLTIRSQGIEGNADPLSGLFVYLGRAGGQAHDINARSLPTVASGHGCAQYTGLAWEIRGPAQVNVRLMNSSPGRCVHGWYVAGELRQGGA